MGGIDGGLLRVLFVGGLYIFRSCWSGFIFLTYLDKVFGLKYSRGFVFG